MRYLTLIAFLLSAAFSFSANANAQPAGETRTTVVLGNAVAETERPTGATVLAVLPNGELIVCRYGDDYCARRFREVREEMGLPEPQPPKQWSYFEASLDLALSAVLFFGFMLIPTIAIGLVLLVTATILATIFLAFGSLFRSLYHWTFHSIEPESK